MCTNIFFFGSAERESPIEKITHTLLVLFKLKNVINSNSLKKNITCTVRGPEYENFFVLKQNSDLALFKVFFLKVTHVMFRSKGADNKSASMLHLQGIS